jgi:hypothetical protein
MSSRFSKHFYNWIFVTNRQILAGGWANSKKLILGISFFCQNNSPGGEFLNLKQILKNLVYWPCFQVSDLRVAEDSIVFEFAVKSRFLSSFGEEERHEERFQT